MLSGTRSDFHTDLATTVLKDIQYQRSNYYYFIGKVEPWGESDVPPDVLQDSYLEDTKIRSNILFIKRISPSDVSLVTTRYNWISGTVYAKWNHTQNMDGQKFYCVTDDFNVYKCLDNAAGSLSTVKPTETSFVPFRTSDGYLWKYMYNIPRFKQNKFTSSAHIPVQKALADSFYNKGSIDAVAVVNSGDGYSNELQTLVNVTNTGHTTGSGAVFTITEVDALGQIVSVELTTPGSGYHQTLGALLVFNSDTGENASGTVTFEEDGTTIKDIVFISRGVGYAKNTDTVSVVTGGAVIIPMLDSQGSIVDVKIMNPGAGYTSAPPLTVAVTGGSTPGTGAYGNAEALMNAIVYNGKIVRVNIQDPGVNYPIIRKTFVTVTGDGSGAVVTPVIYGGKLIDCIVENAGTGYSTAILTVGVTSGGGSGAQLLATIASSDFISDQSIIEQTAVRGAIYSVVVTEPGTDYSAITTTVSISGDGSGATAHAVFGQDGYLKDVVMDTYGSGYTYATVTITDPTREDTEANIEASAYVILPPTNGHGYDAPAELFGKSVVVDTVLKQDFLINMINQDYRQFGIIKNPAYIASGKTFRIDSDLIVYNVKFDTVTNLLPDSVLVQGYYRYRVVYVDVGESTAMLQQLDSNNMQPYGSMILESDNTKSYVVKNIVVYPSVNKYSGKLLFVSNEAPFEFSEQQGLIVKTFLNF